MRKGPNFHFTVTVQSRNNAFSVAELFEISTSLTSSEQTIISAAVSALASDIISRLLNHFLVSGTYLTFIPESLSFMSASRFSERLRICVCRL